MSAFTSLPRWSHALWFAVSMTGCFSTTSNAPTGASASGGTAELHFALTDAPGPFDQILVHVTAIDVHAAPTGAAPATADDAADGGMMGDEGGSDGGSASDATASADAWTTIATPDQTIDLLTLQNGVTLDAGGATLPSGSYDMVRLLVSSGSVVVGGQSFPLTIPSGMQSGIKLRYDLSLSADVATTITLDFDGAASIVETGNGTYILKPVLTVKSRDDHARAPEDRADGGSHSSASGMGGNGGGGAGGAGGGGGGSGKDTHSGRH